MFLKLESASASPERLVKAEIAGLHPRVFYLVGLGKALKICMSSKISGDTDTAGLKISLGGPLIKSEIKGSGREGGNQELMMSMLASLILF